MSDASNAAIQPRDRSPAYPVIPLEAAFQRLVEFEAHFKRSAARPEKMGDAWGVKTKAYADRIAAAMRYFGLLEYQGAGKDRNVTISEEGRKYLRAQQEGTKREIVKAAALRPKQIAKYWNDWGADRPADAACLDVLVLTDGFSEAGARDFLKVYDATIAYAGLSASDKVAPIDGSEESGDLGGDDDDQRDSPPPSPPPRNQGVKLMDAERELVTGPLSGDARFRLIVSGHVGSKEIGRLLRKLEMEKEIVEEAEATVASQASHDGDGPA